MEDTLTYIPTPDDQRDRIARNEQADFDALVSLLAARLATNNLNEPDRVFVDGTRFIGFRREEVRQRAAKVFRDRGWIVKYKEPFFGRPYFTIQAIP